MNPEESLTAKLRKVTEAENALAEAKDALKKERVEARLQIAKKALLQYAGGRPDLVDLIDTLVDVSRDTWGDIYSLTFQERDSELQYTITQQDIDPKISRRPAGALADVKVRVNEQGDVILQMMNGALELPQLWDRELAYRLLCVYRLRAFAEDAMKQAGI